MHQDVFLIESASSQMGPSRVLGWNIQSTPGLRRKYLVSIREISAARVLNAVDKYLEAVANCTDADSVTLRFSQRKYTPLSPRLIKDPIVFYVVHHRIANLDVVLYTEGSASALSGGPTHTIWSQSSLLHRTLNSSEPTDKQHRQILSRVDLDSLLFLSTLSLTVNTVSAYSLTTPKPRRNKKTI